MSARALFRQADLARALRAATKAGVPVRVEIEPGRMIVTPIAGQAPVSANSFDGIFS